MGSAVVEHLRLFMEVCTDAVTAEFPHDAVPVFFPNLLYRMTDTPQLLAWLDLLDPPPHGLVRDLAQPPGRDPRLANVIHAAGIPVVTVLDHGHVYV